MTEFVPLAELPNAVENQQRLRKARKVTKVAWHYAAETVHETFPDGKTQKIAGALAAFGAASAAAEAAHLFDHSGTALEFLQGSGKHFVAGYVGAMTGLAKSKAETVRGKIIAGSIGGALGDFAAEIVQGFFITELVHHGNLHDATGYLPPRGLTKDNFDDGAAAMLAAEVAIAQRLTED